MLRTDALVAQGHKEEALAQLVPASGLPPSALAAKRAEVLLGLGREEEAGRRAGEAAAAGVEGKGQAAEVYQRAGRHAEAVPLLVDLLTADPDFGRAALPARRRLRAQRPAGRGDDDLPGAAPPRARQLDGAQLPRLHVGGEGAEPATRRCA